MMNKALLYGILIPWMTTLHAQKKYDLFFLTIGSAHYIQDGKAEQLGYPAFNNLDAATTSAKKMGELFVRMGAESGRVSLSSPSTYITHESILSDVRELIHTAKKSKARRPLLIVYYAGHGYSSGQYKSHFIPPGDFRQNPEALDTEGWLTYGIVPLDIRELLDESKIDYIMLLDCCYEGEQRETTLDISEEEQDLTGTSEVVDLFGQITNAFDNMNTMTGPDPVVFSCPPGGFVPVTLMDFGEGKEEVAPLCRRSFLTIKSLAPVNISVSDFIVMLQSDELDHRTQEAFSTWSFDAKNLNWMYKDE